MSTMKSMYSLNLHLNNVRLKVYCKGLLQTIDAVFNRVSLTTLKIKKIRSRTRTLKTSRTLARKFRKCGRFVLKNNGVDHPSLEK
jgi:hypothetical protein